MLSVIENERRLEMSRYATRIFITIISVLTLSQVSGGSAVCGEMVVPSFEEVLSLRTIGSGVISPDGGRTVTTRRYGSYGKAKNLSS